MKGGSKMALSNNPLTGTSSPGPGVTGESDTGDGVLGHGETGVHGQAVDASGTGVWGENTGNGYGVKGSTNSTFNLGRGGISGVWGDNAGTGTGVKGTSTGGDGVLGYSLAPHHAGVSAVNVGGGFGVFASGVPAGQFQGAASGAAGVVAHGGFDAPGIVGRAGPGRQADGVQGFGNGPVSGVAGFGGADQGNGAGTGVVGSGGGPNGAGVRGLGAGGPDTVPSDPVGVYGQGGPDAPGVVGQGGPGNADGVQGWGNGPSSGVAGFGGADNGNGAGTGVFGIGGVPNGTGVRGIGAGGPNTLPDPFNQLLEPVGVYGQAAPGSASGCSASAARPTSSEAPARASSASPVVGSRFVPPLNAIPA